MHPDERRIISASLTALTGALSAYITQPPSPSCRCEGDMDSGRSFPWACPDGQEISKQSPMLLWTEAGGPGHCYSRRCWAVDTLAGSLCLGLRVGAGPGVRQVCRLGLEGNREAEPVSWALGCLLPGRAHWHAEENAQMVRAAASTEG